MYKIFIADDEAIIREGIKCLLDYESLGFTIVGEAANGKKAYEQILSLMPDVVFLDIHMPEMPGLDVIREAKAHGFNGKVIILSGYSHFKYARDAIRYGVQNYLTKPIDEEELEETLLAIKEQLDAALAMENAREHYRKKAKDAILTDIFLGNADFSSFDPEELHLLANVYQVVIYEQYNRNTLPPYVNYSFSDLFRVANEDRSHDSIYQGSREIVLLKGQFAIQKFNEFLEHYRREKHPQKASPLDSLFIAYGGLVFSLPEVKDSYRQAASLADRRFFCEQGQHTVGYMDLPGQNDRSYIINDAFKDAYTRKLSGYLQACNRNMLAETLSDLQTELYNAADSIPEIRLFLTDLCLRIKEHINRLYHAGDIPFPGNGEIIRAIEDCLYLYEIILYLTELFELVISSMGSTSRESVLDDILYYINHNFAGNITLENIAPLFGYNSSYLGKIFSKKVGENFNSYIDHVRIEHSKELLLSSDMKVYSVAEKVGYRNVDYFHIKFKKYVGQSPAEFRKGNRTDADFNA